MGLCVNAEAPGSQGMALSSLELESQVSVGCPTRVLGTESRSSPQAEYALLPTTEPSFKNIKYFFISFKLKYNVMLGYRHILGSTQDKRTWLLKHLLCFCGKNIQKSFF